MARLLFFGKLAELAGGRERTAPLPPDVATIEALIDMISADDTPLGEALRKKSVRCIVNEQIQNTSTVISDSDEIAFLPPVSGG